jgi:hypothetical protein
LTRAVWQISLTVAALYPLRPNTCTAAAKMRCLGVDMANPLIETNVLIFCLKHLFNMSSINIAPQ